MVSALPGGITVTRPIADQRRTRGTTGVVGTAAYHCLARTGETLRLVVVFGFGGRGDVEPQFTELEAEGLTGDPQHAGRLPPAPLRVPQDQRQQVAVQL